MEWKRVCVAALVKVLLICEDESICEDTLNKGFLVGSMKVPPIEPGICF